MDIKYKTYELLENGYCYDTVLAVDIDEAVKFARETFVGVYDFDLGDKTIYVSVGVFNVDDYENDSTTIKIRVDPPEPDCEADEHDWQSPIEVVGGIKENPGVWGNQGGVIITEVCAHCGMYRCENTWDQHSETGEPVETVSYREADDESKVYADVQRVFRASSLDDLLEALNCLDINSESVRKYGILHHFPTFSENIPEDTRSIWSWDDDRLLVGESSTFEIVYRNEWDHNILNDI